jgi:hypothetical protein
VNIGQSAGITIDKSQTHNEAFWITIGVSVTLKGLVPSLVLGLLDVPAETLNDGLFPLVASIATENL